MREDVEVFLSNAAKHFLREGIYDLAAFHIEQALQLYTKYILAKELGYFPKNP